MVYAFTQEQKVIIESRGYTVIEFKNMLYKTKKTFDIVYDNVKRFVDACVEVINRVANAAVEAFKRVFKPILDVIHEEEKATAVRYNFPTGQRYKLVRILYKCTGIDKKRLWKAVRLAYLARSNC